MDSRFVPTTATLSHRTARMQVHSMICAVSHAPAVHEPMCSSSVSTRSRTAARILVPSRIPRTIARRVAHPARLSAWRSATVACPEGSTDAPPPPSPPACTTSVRTKFCVTSRGRASRASANTLSRALSARRGRPSSPVARDSSSATRRHKRARHSGWIQRWRNIMSRNMAGTSLSPGGGAPAHSVDTMSASPSDAERMVRTRAASSAPDRR
mmetsp:Transcript_24989/g.49670  ORF Transcript_24989/g.49670 Transcript_24989/m.49670 type:complete len:212 (-) Transcript_24989:649-1284(-)